ncbi:hypothetical protein Btru_039999 [Bulinus truncatus]|nr:hypothetical protein Btru_039999 [Bulinus truncatus]
MEQLSVLILNMEVAEVYDIIFVFVLAALAGALAYVYEPNNSDFTAARGIERVIKHSPPFFLSGLTYGLVVGMLGKIRDRDDFKNHIFGGLASGTVLGSWYKSPAMGAYGGLLLAGICGCYKYISNDDMIPQPRRQRVFNMYRTGWFTDRPNPEGIQDAELDDNYKRYKA